MSDYKRVFPILLAVGIAWVVIGAVLMALTPSAPPTAHAALPAGHPSLAEAEALVQTTVNDFFLPGTQPNQLTDTLVAPLSCRGCHENYAADLGQDPETEPWTGWAGSMMAQSGRDPLFYAALDIANADAEGAGEFCLRCHLPSGWLEGRSDAVDGSAMTATDQEGVQCIVCHRMVDPVYSEENPERDSEILAGITATVSITGSASMIIDPIDYRRGPFDLSSEYSFDPHWMAGAAGSLESPYHRESDFCGTCHDITNPIFSWDEGLGEYVLNALDTPGDVSEGFPIERTFSEWQLSDYNSPQGVYASAFGGNKTYVSTCQDCHMRDVTGVAAGQFQPPVREDMPMHDLTGANTWVPQIIPLHPVFSQTFNEDPARAQALISGTLRARAMLQNAASVSTIWEGERLTVTVVNRTGHKLPTGYPEGRRMWLQVVAYDEQGNEVYTSGAYNVATGELTQDADLQVYEVKQGITPGLAAQLDGIESGPSFHFALNNGIVSDNRIPPRGYEFDAFAAAGAAPYTDWLPDPARYADGQYWDTTVYTLPEGAAWGRVRLLYQVASKEYVAFLRDNNPNVADPDNNGRILYDLWEQTERSKPEEMAVAYFFENSIYLPAVTNQ